jgi:hypothetical protein
MCRLLILLRLLKLNNLLAPVYILSAFSLPLTKIAHSVCALTSAREEAVRIGHFVANFEFSRGLESHHGDTGDHREQDRRVLAPVGRTAVPATGRGPDVFWVAVVSLVGVLSFAERGDGCKRQGGGRNGDRRRISRQLKSIRRFGMRRRDTEKAATTTKRNDANESVEGVTYGIFPPPP